MCRHGKWSEQLARLRVCMEVMKMAPVLLVAGGGEGGGEESGVRPLLLIDRPDTPAGFHAPPPDVEGSDVMDLEEGEDMATNTERIAALEEGQKELVEVAHRLEVGQEKAMGERALQGQQIAGLVADVAKIPAVEAKAATCAENTTKILAILQGAGMVAPTAADASNPTGGPIAVNNPTAQMMHFLMPAIRQLPPQIILLLVAYLLFTGKLTG